MRPSLASKPADAFYLDEECSNNEASSSLDTDDDDLDEHDYLNNENSLDEQSAVRCEKTNGARSAKKSRANKKIDYLKKRKCRTTFSKLQLSILESEFIQSNFVSNEKIDYLVQSTGLDSRIIKNWFKNKRSRVLADSKTNSMTPHKQPNSLAKHIKAEPVNDEVKAQKSPFCTPNPESSSNKNLNGLFNVVHSIGSDEKRSKPTDDKPKPKLDLNSVQCCRSGQELCNCSVSNQALKRLYKYCAGFNTIDFVYCNEESHDLSNSDENGKYFLLIFTSFSSAYIKQLNNNNMTKLKCSNHQAMSLHES
ncbi:hypothetical protein BpHYR1_033775 [Brachionus plicatilis]|uniref:Homeobox domain-containing protein n=1 Tax=Brachionus plicatilis TaxID=10195 RepID=A0A3M7R963_BRAPC|nr:hypothetical protein BpHYR1_033775 [Brachionus plicatilis]